MSQTTTIRYYSDNPKLISGDALVRCIEASGATKTNGCMRATSERSSWRAFKEGAEFDQKWDWLGSSLSPANAATLVRDGYELSIDLGAAPMVREIYVAVLNEMPPAIYGEHIPANMSVTVGWHDIYENIENEDGTLFARASFSINFWGNFIPPDITEYRIRFFKLAAAIEIQKRLELLFGPLNSCIILNT